MPGCKMSFKKSAGGGKRIGGGSGVSVGAYGMDIHSDTAHFGGNTGPAMSKRAEPAAAPPAKAKAASGTGKSGGMFG